MAIPTDDYDCWHMAVCSHHASCLVIKDSDSACKTRITEGITYSFDSEFSVVGKPDKCVAEGWPVNSKTYDLHIVPV